MPFWQLNWKWCSWTEISTLLCCCYHRQWLNPPCFPTYWLFWDEAIVKQKVQKSWASSSLPRPANTSPHLSLLKSRQKFLVRKVLSLYHRNKTILPFLAPEMAKSICRIRNFMNLQKPSHFTLFTSRVVTCTYFNNSIKITFSFVLSISPQFKRLCKIGHQSPGWSFQSRSWKPLVPYKNS